jgi:hypothetical protein
LNFFDIVYYKCLLFYLFLKFIQINFIFSNNKHVLPI